MNTRTTISNTRAGAWGRARALADATPADRNRYVDFLRAVSILAVVVGHWLVAAPYVSDGQLRGGHLLAIAPWTHWLTWLFQVMPVFFLVGGYANAASWKKARDAGQSHGEWLSGRIRRLVAPVLPLLATWLVLATALSGFGVDRALVGLGSQAALVPLWFLAVYVLVAALTPWTLRLWERYRTVSLALGMALAAAIDLVGLGAGVEAIRWLNYPLVWATVHQLGYAWEAGTLSRPARAAAWGLGGLTGLVLLIDWLGYPVAMVGVPGAEVANTQPPTLALLALGVLQTGILVSWERPLRRWLERPMPWAATILVNGMIMSIYLWHLTAMVIVIGLATLAGDLGLGLVPATAGWWLSRPLWIALLALATAALVGVFARFERPRPTARSNPVSLWKPAAATTAICAGLGILAYGGIASEAWPGVRLWALALPFAAGALVGLFDRGQAGNRPMGVLSCERGSWRSSPGRPSSPDR